MTIGLPLYVNGCHTIIHPWAFHSWDTLHATKGPLDDLLRTFTYAELFALPLTPSRYESKLDCGEIDKIIQYAHPDERQCLTFRQAREWLKI
jgi:hypothetical protein